MESVNLHVTISGVSKQALESLKEMLKLSSSQVVNLALAHYAMELGLPIQTPIFDKQDVTILQEVRKEWEGKN